MLALSSGLGPSEIECLKCANPVQTDRTEWAEMATGQRFWFSVMTLVYVVMLGLITGNFIDNAWSLWNLQPGVNLDYESPVFQVAASVGGVLALSLQVLRLMTSNRRVRTPYKLSVLEYLFGIQWNLQLKCLLLLSLLWGIARLKYEMAMP